MKTTFNVSAKELAELLAITAKWAGDEAVWDVSDWIMDVIGISPESPHDWNSLSKEEIESGFDKQGFQLCCRDQLHEMHMNLREITPALCIQIIYSWIEMHRISNQPRPQK